MEKELLLTDIFESSLTISEKRKFYCEESEVDNNYLMQWKNKKNLITEEIFKDILEKNEMDEKEFNYCISPLKFTEKFIYPNWLVELDKILEYYDSDSIKKIENKDISLVITPFVQYVAYKLSELDWDNSLMKFSDTAIQDILTNYAKDITIYIEKNIVVELYQYKTTHDFKNNNTQQQFSEFIEEIFCEKEKYYYFLKKYAVSTRLITTRTIFFIDNIVDLVNALKESEQEMINILNIEITEIIHVELSVGDSHEKGKGVIVVEFDKDKVVYKPKNLDVCESYEKFIEWINKNSSLLDIKTPIGIYKNTYALIEFIKYKSCKSIDEIKSYYERFGYTLALGYILAMTDMHLENIVANTEYPVIIDGETILQNSIRFSNNNTVMNKFRTEFYLETILATAMLPNTAKIDKDLDLSSLAGDEQKSTKKYLTPINVGTSDFHYEEMEYLMSASNNIPILNDSKVNYKDYVYYVINGFNKMIDFIYTNKDFLLSKKSPLHYFADKKIRFLTKSTQVYGELLGFLTHPTCCSQMLVRERTLQNIWAYPHHNKEIIKSEYKDMLFNDIPIFYTLTSSTSLYDSYSTEYKDYFEKTGYDKILDRVNGLDKEVINRQMDVLLMHLGKYTDYKLTEFSRKDYTFNFPDLDVSFEAEKIAQKLIKTAILDEDDNISWPFVAISKNSTIFSLTAVDLYEGLTGIALFFIELYYDTKKDIYFEYYKKCVRCCASEFDNFPNEFSAFGQKFSLISPIILEIRLLGSSIFEPIIHKTIKSLYATSKKEIINSNSFNIDWISGISGLLAVLTNILDEYKLISDIEKKNIEKIANNLYLIIINKLNEGDFEENIGQAHGYSGIMLALARYSKFVDKNTYNQIKNTVKTYLRKEILLTQFKMKEVKDKWCHGLSGMIISRIEILKNIPDEEIDRDLKQMIKDLIECQESLYNGDSLCHGNSGTIISLKICIENGYDIQNKLREIYNKMLSQVIGEKLYTQNYKVLNTITVDNPTLFTGLAGIGYMLLKTTKKIKNNILTLT
ncbi:MAG: type 2 lanthipeptide synthetase LanM [Lachnotalea sp.]